MDGLQLFMEIDGIVIVLAMFLGVFLDGWMRKHNHDH
jgi:hypothetical protein